MLSDNSETIFIVVLTILSEFENIFENIPSFMFFFYDQYKIVLRLENMSSVRYSSRQREQSTASSSKILMNSKCCIKKS